MNAPTILIGLIIFVLFAAIVARGIHNKRQGKGGCSCGGSCSSCGCGCSAAVFNGYLLRGLREGRWKRLLFAPTGALLSPTSSFQGESIPGICHAVALSAAKEGV